jgi:hypothetical protein
MRGGTGDTSNGSMINAGANPNFYLNLALAKDDFEFFSALGITWMAVGAMFVGGSQWVFNPATRTWSPVGRIAPATQSEIAAVERAALNSARFPRQIGGSVEFPLFKSSNDAQRAAIEWLREAGYTGKLAQRTTSKFTGQVCGMEEVINGHRVGWRIEFDVRSGAHLNVYSGAGKGPHFLFPGQQADVTALLRQLFP